MNRFAAIAWNHRSDKAEADAAKLLVALEGKDEWRKAWAKSGVVIFERSMQSAADFSVACEETFLVGAVFDQVGQKAPTEAIDSAAARESGGGQIFRQVWGRYVAFIRDEPNACLYVARDPSGALPCFVGKRGWAFVFFSNPADVRLFDLDRKWIDWSYVAQRLVNNRRHSERTGLQGIVALGPGCVARVGQGRIAISEHWRAEEIAADAIECSHQDAVERLREAVELSCGAWARCFANTGLRLSGGLDSSIVAGAIAPHSHVEALNFATPNAEGDERIFARAAAAFVGVALTEHCRDPALVDLEAAACLGCTLNPPLWIADTETDVVEAQFVRDKGVSAIFSGRGGDNVFFRSEQPHVLADWLARNGVSAEFLRRAWMYALASGEPFSRAIVKAFALRAQARTAAAEYPFLTKKAVELARDDEERGEGDQLPPGKRLHIRSLADRLNYFDYRAHADYIYPLVSQPVLETCLRLPTYVLSPAGGDRALAREAFADRIAPAILARQSKGRTNSYLARILIRHVAFLRRFLIEGELAGAGLVDRDALSSALTEGALVRSMDAMAAIVGLLGVEAWLRRPPLPSTAVDDAAERVS